MTNTINKTFYEEGKRFLKNYRTIIAEGLILAGFISFTLYQGEMIKRGDEINEELSQKVILLEDKHEQLLDYVEKLKRNRNSEIQVFEESSFIRI